VKRVNKGEEAGSNFAAAFGFNAFSVFPSFLSIFRPRKECENYATKRSFNGYVFSSKNGIFKLAENAGKLFKDYL